MTEPDVNGPWMGLEPGDGAGLFNALGIRWWIAGGWALDLAAGRAIRPHGDLDVAVPRAQAFLLTGLTLAGWEVYVAHQGTLTPWDGGTLEPPRWQFWVREPGGPRWAFEVMLEDIALAEDSEWRFRRDASIRRLAREFGSVADTSRGPVPYVVPEIVLLYKAADPTGRNATDFEVIVDLLSPGARTWLRDALQLVAPRHAWLQRL
ncbi:MAG: amino acid transporter [Dehalococcoidia bacterium]